MEAPTVTLLTKKGCTVCKMLKDLLIKMELPFKEEEANWVNTYDIPNKSLPILIIEASGGKIIYNGYKTQAHIEDAIARVCSVLK